MKTPPFAPAAASLLLLAACSTTASQPPAHPADPPAAHTHTHAAPGAPGTHVRWDEALRQPAGWYASQEALRIGSQLVAVQLPSGGWGKNADFASPRSREAIAAAIAADPDLARSTIDNKATWSHLRFLARVIDAAGDSPVASHVDAFFRGFDHLLAAQYANGGWPQFFPLRKGYYSRITFNDGAMVGVLELLDDAARGTPPFGFVDDSRRARAREAVARGTRCILDTQVVIAGRRTVWCAQHDEVTLAPAPARAFEPATLSGGESVGIVRFLLRSPDPSPEIVGAVEDAAAWFTATRLSGIRVETIRDASGAPDRIVVADPAAPPLWARFYEIPSNRPVFTGRDGVIRYALADIERERRSGYAWYVTTPARLLDAEIPAWRTRLKR